MTPDAASEITFPTETPTPPTTPANPAPKKLTAEEIEDYNRKIKKQNKEFFQTIDNPDNLPKIWNHAAAIENLFTTCLSQYAKASEDATFRGVPILPASEWGKRTSGLFAGVKNEDYHATRRFLSRSNISDMCISPAHCYAKAIGEIENKKTDALIFGEIFHSYILEGKTHESLGYVARPEGLTLTTKNGIEWKTQQLAAGLEILSPAISAQIREDLPMMREKILAHPTAKALILNSKNGGICEHSVCAQNQWGIECFGAPLVFRVRPDLLPLRGNAVIDAKTCLSADPKGFAKHAWEYGYFLQAALYLHTLELAGFGEQFQNFVFVAVEKASPYNVEVFNVEKGSNEYTRALDEIRYQAEIYASCQESGEWPGYTNGKEFHNLFAPAWAKYRSEIEGPREEREIQ